MVGGPVLERYQGQNAEAVPPCPTHAPTRARLLLVVGGAAGLCLGLAALLAVAGISLPPTVTHFAVTLRVVASAMFLGAGVLRLSRWRISGDGRNALMGVALVVLGGTAIPFAAIAGLASAGVPGALHEPLTRSVTTVIILTLVLRAVVSDRTTEQPPTIWLMVGAVAAAGGGLIGVLALERWSPGALYAGLVARAGLELTLALAWLGVAAFAWRRHGRYAWAGRVAPLLGAMGVVAVLRGVAVYRSGAFDLASATLAAVVSCVVAYCALIDLVDTTVTEHEHLRSVVDGQQSWREEFRHDARNSLAGLRATLTTLDRYGGRLTAETAAGLRSAAIGEIGHLDHLIIGSERATPVDFSVDEVVRTVVDIRRSTGLEVRLEVGHDRAHGVPGDLATALQNLLVNAQQHAPGHPVTVRSECAVETLEIRVSDHGAAIPDRCPERLFERGETGDASSGSGLGLYVARQLMRDQGGDLRLVSRTGGWEFALSMPLARPQPAPIPRQRSAGSRAVVEAL
ncbi:MAG: sensor histidine kinase [Nocardioidaceae bacterium]